MARQQVAEKGYDHALILNTQNHLACTCSGNIFSVKNGNLYTPNLNCGILDGITRKKVLTIAGQLGLKVYESTLTLEDVHSSDELFITNSLIKVCPVSQLEKTFFSDENIITRQIMQSFQTLIMQEFSYTQIPCS